MCKNDLIQSQNEAKPNKTRGFLSKFLVGIEGLLVAGLGIFTGAVNEQLFKASTWQFWKDHNNKDINFSICAYVVFGVVVIIVAWKGAQQRNKATMDLKKSSENLNDLVLDLKESSENLNDLVLTQPPLMFLQQFQNLYGRARNSHYNAVLNYMDKDARLEDKQDVLAVSIRSVLRGLCLIADYYNDHQLGEYTATTLWFVDIDEMDDDFKSSVVKYLKFVPKQDPKILANYDGLLLLVKQLCFKDNTKSENVFSETDLKLTSEEVEENPELTSEEVEGNSELTSEEVEENPDAYTSIGLNDEVHLIALPIPSNPYATLKDGSIEWFTLPGGPHCFVDGGVVLLSDTLNIREWCEQDSGLSQSVQEKLVEYMNIRSKDRFRAFLSIPIYSTASSENTKPIGVINLESTEPGFFSERSLSSGNQALDERRLKEFVAIAHPFILLLQELIELYGKDSHSITSDYSASISNR